MSTPTQNVPAAQPATATITPFPVTPAAAGSGTAELQRLVEQPFSAFGSMSQFKDAQRMATMLAHSSIVPENYRGDEHIGDCVIALEIANRIGASILAVMQNLYLVQGKPAWSSQFLISCVNATKRFSPIRYQMTGQPGEDSWGCIACATDKTGESLRSPEVSIGMAKEEGWYYRQGSKWKTMPELMLCHRSATLFTRLYAPEITMGIQTAEEVVDMGPEGNGAPNRPIFEPGPSEPKFEPKSKFEHRDAVPKAHQPKAIENRRSGCAFPATTAYAGQKSSEAQVLEPAASQAVAALPQPAKTPQPQTGQYNYLKALTGLVSLSQHAEANVVRFLCNTHRCDDSLATLREVAEKKPSTIIWAHDNWKAVDREITRLKKGQGI